LPPIRRRREREEEERRQEIEKRLKEHKEKVTTDIEQRVAAAVNEMAPSGGLPLVQVPSAHKSSCASAAVPEEQRAIEGVQVDSQWSLWMISVSAPDVSFTSHSATLKDRLGDKKGGSEWELIKIILKQLGLCPNRNSKSHTRTPIAKTT
jgi:hypothetical protein